MMQRGHLTTNMMNPPFNNTSIGATGMRPPHRGTGRITIMQQRYRPATCLMIPPQSSKPDGNHTGSSASHMGGNNARRVLPRLPPRRASCLSHPLSGMVTAFAECARLVHPVNVHGSLVKMRWTCIKYSLSLRLWMRSKLPHLHLCCLNIT